jgi:hypothetical protein
MNIDQESFPILMGVLARYPIIQRVAESEWSPDVSEPVLNIGGNQFPASDRQLLRDFCAFDRSDPHRVHDWLSQRYPATIPLLVSRIFRFSAHAISSAIFHSTKNCAA